MREVVNLGMELYRVACFMSDWESSQEVEGLYLRALRGKEEAWGAKHTSTLGTFGNLGNVYADQGKMKEAEEMYLRALRGYELMLSSFITPSVAAYLAIVPAYFGHTTLNRARLMTYIEVLMSVLWGASSILSAV